MIAPMTPEPPETAVSTVLPDLRAVRLDEMPALTPDALDQVVARVLPGRATQTVALATPFASGI